MGPGGLPGPPAMATNPGLHELRSHPAAETSFLCPCRRSLQGKRSLARGLLRGWTGLRIAGHRGPLNSEFCPDDLQREVLDRIQYLSGLGGIQEAWIDSPLRRQPSRRCSVAGQSTVLISRQQWRPALSSDSPCRIVWRTPPLWSRCWTRSPVHSCSVLSKC